MNGLDGIKSVTALLFLCFGFFHVIHANENGKCYEDQSTVPELRSRYSKS